MKESKAMVKDSSENKYLKTKSIRLKIKQYRVVKKTYCLKAAQKRCVCMGR